jgi:hypothetical protein
MTNITTNINAYGYVEIWALYEDGSKELLWGNKNTLTSKFYTSITRLLAGEVGEFLEGTRTVQNGTARWASYMKIGKGTTAPTVSDLDVEDAIQESGNDLILNISTVSFGVPQAGSVNFNAILPVGDPGSEYNTTPLTEVGIFSEVGEMLARQVYDPLEKTTAFQLQYSWTFTFRS